MARWRHGTHGTKRTTRGRGRVYLMQNQRWDRPVPKTHDSTEVSHFKVFTTYECSAWVVANFNFIGWLVTVLFSRGPGQADHHPGRQAQHHRGQGLNPATTLVLKPTISTRTKVLTPPTLSETSWLINPPSSNLLAFPLFFGAYHFLA